MMLSQNKRINSPISFWSDVEPEAPSRLAQACRRDLMAATEPTTGYYRVPNTAVGRLIWSASGIRDRRNGTPGPAGQLSW